MWIVYRRGQDYLTGFEVATETEAWDYCESNPGFTYCYVREENYVY